MSRGRGAKCFFCKVNRPRRACERPIDESACSRFRCSHRMTEKVGALFVVVADVAGHSIGAALLMAMARTIIRREIADGKQPAAVLAATNTSLYEDLVRSNLFITAFCARYDPDRRVLEYANAGHNR